MDVCLDYCEAIDCTGCIFENITKEEREQIKTFGELLEMVNPSQTFTDLREGLKQATNGEVIKTTLHFPDVYKYDYDKKEYYKSNLGIPDHDHYHRVYDNDCNYDLYEDICLN